jgi:2-succinyl-5-enolpyruvyl-6-hydroxy-3-cyclohexene-1-carboxylate synthase
LLVPGQAAPDAQLDGVVKYWLQDPRVVVLMEPVGNLLNGFQSSERDEINRGVTSGLVYRQEDILAHDNAHLQGLRPDVIISWGLQIVGKRTRNWLRRQSETNKLNPIGLSRPRHFRLDPLGWTADPYHNPPEVIRTAPFQALHAVSDVLNQDKSSVEGTLLPQKFRNSPLTAGHLTPASAESYQEQWRLLEQKIEDILVPLLKHLPFCDLAAIKVVSRYIGADYAVHLGNSMPVRYWQMLGSGVRSWWVHANRGTSGIDGVNSTALGFALSVPERTVWLITGDLSFVYDLNVFSCNERPDNLRIVVINNQGGDIFRLIDGPSRQPECEDLFATPRKIDLQTLAMAWGCDTARATNAFELSAVLGQLHSRPAGKGPVVVEVITEPKSNQIVYQSYQKALFYPI